MIPEGTLERFAVGVATKILGKEYKGGLFVWFSCPIETVGQALLPNWSITLETMKEPDKTSLELRGLRGGFSPQEEDIPMKSAEHMLNIKTACKAKSVGRLYVWWSYAGTLPLYCQRI